MRKLFTSAAAAWKLITEDLGGGVRIIDCLFILAIFGFVYWQVSFGMTR